MGLHQKRVIPQFVRQLFRRTSSDHRREGLSGKTMNSLIVLRLSCTLLAGTVCAPFVLPPSWQRRQFYSCVSQRRYTLVRIGICLPRIDPSFSGDVCLHRACITGDLYMISLLLTDERVDPRLGLLTCLIYKKDEAFRLLSQDDRVRLADIDSARREYDRR